MAGVDEQIMSREQENEAASQLRQIRNGADEGTGEEILEQDPVAKLKQDLADKRKKEAMAGALAVKDTSVSGFVGGKLKDKLLNLIPYYGPIKAFITIIKGERPKFDIVEKMIMVFSAVWPILAALFAVTIFFLLFDIATGVSGWFLEVASKVISAVTGK